MHHFFVSLISIYALAGRESHFHMRHFFVSLVSIYAPAGRECVLLETTPQLIADRHLDVMGFSEMYARQCPYSLRDGDRLTCCCRCCPSIWTSSGQSDYYLCYLPGITCHVYIRVLLTSIVQVATGESPFSLLLHINLVLILQFFSDLVELLEPIIVLSCPFIIGRDFTIHSDIHWIETPLAWWMFLPR